MLLESRLADDTALFIDCETVGGFNKSDTSDGFHPDDAIKNVCQIAGQVAAELASSARSAAGAKPSPGSLELEFAVRVDSNATVSIARNSNDGQFKVTVRWGR
jgi:hypothetical protein